MTSVPGMNPNLIQPPQKGIKFAKFIFMERALLVLPYVPEKTAGIIP
jgi:hypothetical protein